MEITKIEIQKKNKNRVNLYLDNEFNCGLSLEVVVKYGLKEGKEINQELLDFLCNSSEKEIAINKAISYIARYQKTEKEIKEYLFKKGFGDEISQDVIKKLKEYNFIDDDLYAQNYIKYKTKSVGKRKLAYELRKKGINESLIDNNIDIYSQDSDSVLLVAEKYLRKKPRDIKTKQKAYRYLLSRGFMSEDIIRALNSMFKEE